MEQTLDHRDLLAIPSGGTGPGPFFDACHFLYSGSRARVFPKAKFRTQSGVQSTNLPKSSSSSLTGFSNHNQRLTDSDGGLRIAMVVASFAGISLMKTLQAGPNRCRLGRVSV